VHIARALSKRHPSRNLCLTGGVALNCVANARILSDTDYEAVWVPPCASDSGAPLGSALWHHHQTLGHPRGFELKHSFHGRGYTDAEITSALQAAGFSYRRMGTEEFLATVAGDGPDVGVVWIPASCVAGEPSRPTIHPLLHARGPGGRRRVREAARRVRGRGATDRELRPSRK